MSADKTTARLSPLRLLQLTAFVSTLDRFAMPPMLIAMARDLGVPLTQIVRAAGAYYLAYGLMQPVWGMVSDRLGIVRTLRLTLLMAAVMTAAAAVTGTPLSLGIARGLAGACFSAATPAGLIYIGDTVPAQRRQREVTSLMVGVALGTAFASVGAGVLAQLLSWRIAFIVTGLAALAMVAALRSLTEPPRTRAHRHVLAPLAQVARSGPARLVLTLAFLEGVVLLGVLTLLPAAVVWVRARARAEADTWQHNVSYRHEQVAETAARWTALTADEPALAAFLATSSFHFTDENELLAAGRAVLSVPART